MGGLGHFHGVAVASPPVLRVHVTRQCPANNRTLEYTNRHSIRAVDRGSYRNLLCSREVAAAGGGEGRAGGSAERARGNGVTSREEEGQNRRSERGMRNRESGWKAPG